ncbi:HNH endonuclease, partial [Actibacterium mucosum KCTC 23349]
MPTKWTQGELEASVAAYMEMRRNELNGVEYSKQAYYRDLSNRFDRSAKAFEYRMQNISYVFSIMGRRWINGLPPAKNVGINVARDIENIINRLEKRRDAPVASFEVEVANIRKKKDRLPPRGNEKPSAIDVTTTRFMRSAEVVAWVLDLANGTCECCGKQAPFMRDHGTPFLEVHHLKRLADGGSDTISNAIAICPNCHRELHYGADKDQRRLVMYDLLERLVE